MDRRREYDKAIIVVRRLFQTAIHDGAIEIQNECVFGDAGVFGGKHIQMGVLLGIWVPINKGTNRGKHIEHTDSIVEKFVWSLSACLISTEKCINVAVGEERAAVKNPMSKHLKGYIRSSQEFSSTVSTYALILTRDPNDHNLQK